MSVVRSVAVSGLTLSPANESLLSSFPQLTGLVARLATFVPQSVGRTRPDRPLGRVERRLTIELLNDGFELLS